MYRASIFAWTRGLPRLLEINSLPGLSPGFSDLCVISEAEGLSYTSLILEILYLGASRFGLLQPAGEEMVRMHVPARMVQYPMSFD